MINEIELVELLRKERHEWLNELQLIKAYLSLNRFEEIEKVIERIIIKSKNEAQISNLNIPKCAALLLTFNWYPHFFKLEYEVIGSGFMLNKYDEELTALLKRWLKVFDSCASKTIENVMTLTFDIKEESARLIFDFVGSLTDHQKIEELLQEDRLNQSFYLVEQYINETEAVIKLQIT
ncbi:stage 0 sporulation protein B (sporulation initiation phosphotransferase) [Scopulibacillus daqui]|uniref:Stage 0 sporulation protein B (Sporulation initiation phosphotransferase) n=1 Tax=Scopulibacillus daqui TaxID=1469162 RepID=A0ABS2PYD3_9BACL|nr:Spo0B C-terminal domain-containing protein [Scopulibacillus daqui]MBM7644710.1 stage 0 sporulation protein B (sporulation initiation phosphotransferase) [Scopulibacillus daqui]